MRVGSSLRGMLTFVLMGWPSEMVIRGNVRLAVPAKMPRAPLTLLYTSGGSAMRDIMLLISSMSCK